MRTRWLHLVFLWSVVALLWPGRATAQGETITWQVTPGFNGAYRAGAWFPVRVTVENTGPDVRGTLDVRFRTGQATTFSQPIDLPHNAKKQIVLPVAGDTDQTGNLVRADLTLRANSQVLKTERLNFNAISNWGLVAGVISNDESALPELTNLVRGQQGGQFELMRLTGADLPDRPELLQSFDVLFIHDVDTSAWTAAQRNALQIWANTGGQLVISGTAQVVRGLADILPVSFEEAGDTASFQSIDAATGWNIFNDTAPPVPILRLTAKPNAEIVLQAENNRPFVVRQSVGTGTITVAAFGLNMVQAAGDPARFWPRILRLGTERQSGWTAFREQGFWMLQQALELPALRLPSSWALLGFLLLYIVTIGPLNYLLLRRLERREWAYLTVPLLVLVFSGGAYAWGSVGRGQAAILSELSIVRVLDDGQRGQSTTLLTLFSPGRRSYDFQAGADTLVSDLVPSWNRQGNGVAVVYAEDSVRVPDLLVDVGAVRALAADHTIDVPQLVATRAANGQITLRNTGDQPVTDVLLVGTDGRAFKVDTLEPGAERTVEFTGNELLQDIALNSSGAIIDRQVVLQQYAGALLSSDFNGGAVAIAPAPPDPDQPVPTDNANPPPAPSNNLYVLGWQARAALPVTLDGRNTDALGETLYIWPVKKEQ